MEDFEVALTGLADNNAGGDIDADTVGDGVVFNAGNNGEDNEVGANIDGDNDAPSKFVAGTTMRLSFWTLVLIQTTT